MVPKAPANHEKGTPTARTQLPTGSSPRLVIWVGSSKDDISVLPGPVKSSLGHRLRQLQDGEIPRDIKPLRHFGAGVFELRERFERNAFRLVYVMNLKKAIYVLHAFMKK